MPPMRTLLADLWHLLTSPANHPVYQRELAGWSYMGIWRRIRRGCLPLIAVLFAATTLCCGGSCGLTVIPDAEFPQDWYIILIALLIGLLAGEAILRAVTGLTATALGATVISAEIEAETYGLLRLTPISPRQIVLAKYAAVLNQVRTPVIMVLLVRLTLVVGTILVLAGALLIGAWLGNTLGIPPVPLPTLATGMLLASYLIAGAFALVAVVLWIVFFVMQPALDVMLFAALGVFASSLARTRANGLLAAGALRLVLWMGSYIVGQLFSTLFSLAAMPVMLLPVMPEWLQQTAGSPAVLVMGGAFGLVLFLVLLVVGEALIVLGLLGLAVGRAQSLPFGS